MQKLTSRTPSASLVISILALVVAASGTAVAASRLASGDRLIKKHSLSGNRLRNHTVGNKQINVKGLAKVPSAATADHATNADSALTAGNSDALGGQVPSAFDASSNFVRSGVVGTQLNQNAVVATFGPFTLTLTCTGTATSPNASIIASSSEPGSEADGMSPPDAGSLITTGAHSSFQTQEFGGVDFIAPSKGQFFGDVMVGINYAGRPATPCIAMALIDKS
jgi:hypothetical protein